MLAVTFFQTVWDWAELPEILIQINMLVYQGKISHHEDVQRSSNMKHINIADISSDVDLLDWIECF